MVQRRYPVHNGDAHCSRNLLVILECLSNVGGEMLNIYQHKCLLVVAQWSTRNVAEIGRNRPAWKLFLVEGGDAPDPRQVPPGALRARAGAQPDGDGQHNSAASYPANLCAPSSSLRATPSSCSELMGRGISLKHKHKEENLENELDWENTKKMN